MILMIYVQPNNADFDFNKYFQMVTSDNEIITIELSEKKAVVLSEETYLSLLQAKESLKKYDELQNRYFIASDN